MADVIACPTCSKKYKLPDKPPATFTCKACNTTMDLSGFAPSAPPPPPPPAAPAALTSSRGGGGRSSSARGRGGARAGAGARGGRGSRGGGGNDDDEDDGGGRPSRGSAKKGNPALLWGGIGGGVLILVLLIVMMNKKAPAAPDPKIAADAAAKRAAEVAALNPTPVVPAAGPEVPAAAEAPKSKFIPLGKVQIHAIEHHPEATADEKAKVDQLVDLAIFQNMGRDSKDAEGELVKLGLKAAPRVVNVFNTIKIGEGFTGRPGMVKSQIADRILRRIDGVIERKFSPRWTPIHAQSESSWAERIGKMWVWWWDTETYKTPMKPWDEKVDGIAADAADPTGSDNAPPPKAPSGMTEGD